MLTMSKTKICPTCKIEVSYTKLPSKKIEKEFGTRKSSSGNLIPQSLCRECRSAHGTKIRKFKAKNKKFAKEDLRSKKIGKGKNKKLVRAVTS